MKNYFERSEIVPGRTEYVKCANLMSTVEELAPSNSNVMAKVSLLPDGTFLAIIDVFADCGKFHSEAKTSSLFSAVKLAQHSILTKIHDWKSVRFSLSSDY